MKVLYSASLPIFGIFSRVPFVGKHRYVNNTKFLATPEMLSLTHRRLYRVAEKK